MLTQARLQELFSYDPETGRFLRLRASGPNSRVGREPGWSNSGYRMIQIDGKAYLAHRLAWLYMTGSWPADEIDHRDCDGMNNRWANLREADRSQNNINKPPYSNNTSGHKGVTKSGDKWIARVGDNPRVYLGTFPDVESARAAYDVAAKARYGEYARAH